MNELIYVTLPADNIGHQLSIGAKDFLAGDDVSRPLGGPYLLADTPILPRVRTPPACCGDDVTSL